VWWTALLCCLFHQLLIAVLHGCFKRCAQRLAASAGKLWATFSIAVMLLWGCL